MASGITAPLAKRLSPFIDQLAATQRMARDQDRQLVRVLTSMREPVAVHGEHLLFINTAFASLLGHTDTIALLGHHLADYVPAEFGTCYGLICGGRCTLRRYPPAWSWN
jgi:hypothetical protein